MPTKLASIGTDSEDLRKDYKENSPSVVVSGISEIGCKGSNKANLDREALEEGQGYVAMAAGCIKDGTKLESSSRSRIQEALL